MPAATTAVTTVLRLAWGWIRTHAAAAVTVALAAAVLAVGLYVYSLRLALQQATLDARNARAIADTTAHHLHGTTLDNRRLVVEVAKGQVHGDSLQRALATSEHAQLVMAGRLAIAERRLQDTTHSTVQRDSTGTVLVTGKLDARDSLGVTITATAEIPPAPARARWLWDVTRAAAQLGIALSCGPNDAIVHVTGPPYLPITVSSVAQDARICRAELPTWHPFSFRAPSLPWIGALLVAGAALERLLHVIGIL